MANPIPNLWRVPELKNQILFTLLILFIYRVGAHSTVPGIDVGAPHPGGVAGAGAEQQVRLPEAHLDPRAPQHVGVVLVDPGGKILIGKRGPPRGLVGLCGRDLEQLQRVLDVTLVANQNRQLVVKLHGMRR